MPPNITRTGAKKPKGKAAHRKVIREVHQPSRKWKRMKKWRPRRAVPKSEERG